MFANGNTPMNKPEPLFPNRNTWALVPFYQQISGFIRAVVCGNLNIGNHGQERYCNS